MEPESSLQCSQEPTLKEDYIKLHYSTMFI
jgi:hypothetical protein